MADSSSSAEESASLSSSTEESASSSSVNFLGVKIKIVLVTVKKEDAQKKIQGKDEDEEKQDTEEEEEALREEESDREEIITQIKTTALELDLNVEIVPSHDLTALQSMEDIGDVRFILVEKNALSTETEILKLLKNEPEIECTPVIMVSYLEDSWKQFVKHGKNMKVCSCTRNTMTQLLRKCRLEEGKVCNYCKEKTEGSENSDDDDDDDDDDDEEEEEEEEEFNNSSQMGILVVSPDFTNSNSSHSDNSAILEGKVVESPEVKSYQGSSSSSATTPTTRVRVRFTAKVKPRRLRLLQK